MSLKQEIQQLLAGFNVPAHIAAKLAAAYDQAARPEIAPGVAVGEAAPDFELVDSRGRRRRLSESLETGPAIVTFFRGAWCPICNLQLAAFERALPEIRAAQAEVFAIHPDTGDLLEDPPEGLHMLTDPDQAVIRAYRLQFTLPREAQEIYLNFIDLDISRRNADGSWSLPVPGTFVIGREGLVRRRHVSADYTQRMEPDEVIEVLREPS